MEYKGEYTVYMHVNKVDGKKYIGITKKPVKQRWNNGKGYPVYNPFGAEVYKIGWECFEHVILNKHISRELALDLEDFYIHRFNTTDKDFGYNVKLNGMIKKGTYEEIMAKSGISTRIGDIDINVDELKKYALEKRFVCIQEFWEEFLGMDGKPNYVESREIGRILTSFSFIRKRSKSMRINGYGVVKVWGYVGDIVENAQ